MRGELRAAAALLRGGQAACSSSMSEPCVLWMRFFAKGTAPVSANDLVLPDDLIPGVREKSEKRRWPTTADINIKGWVKAHVSVPKQLKFKGPQTYIPPKGVDRMATLLADGGNPYADLLGVLTGPAAGTAHVLRAAVDKAASFGAVKDFNYLQQYVAREKASGGEAGDP